MNELITTTPASLARNTDQIAAEINNIKQQTQNMLLYNSIEIGRRLVEAKSLLEHGTWGEWLDEHVHYSKSTANNLMRIFDEYGSSQLSFFIDNAKAPALQSINYSQAVALLGLPAEEREAFVEEHDMTAMSTRELQQAIKERDEAREWAEAYQKAADETKSQIEGVLADRDSLMEELKTIKESSIKVQNELKTTMNMERQTLADQKNKIAELKKQIKAIESKPLDVHQGATEEDISAATQKIESEYVGQLAKLEADKAMAEKRIRELEEKAARQNNEALVRYSVHFENLVKGFQALLFSLGEIKSKDPEAHARYSSAVRKLMDKMGESL